MPVNSILDGIGGPIRESHHLGPEGFPAGGHSYGMGYWIQWQSGPVDRAAGEPANGAFPEDLILSLIARLEFLDGGVPSDYNGRALAGLRIAHDELMARRRDREERGVLGTH